MTSVCVTMYIAVCIIYDVVYMNVHVSRCLKEELALAIDKWLWVISNTMLFKTVIPLRI